MRDIIKFLSYVKQFAKSSEEVICFISEVPLDDRNGAGVRVVNSYFSNLNKSVKYISIYLRDDLSFSDNQHAYFKFKKTGIINGILFLVLAELFLLKSKKINAVILPNGKDDIFLGTLFALSRKFNSITWIMDDCLAPLEKTSFFNRLVAKLFLKFSDKVIVISEGMKRAYQQRYQITVDAILGKYIEEKQFNWSKANRKIKTDSKIKIIWMGKFQYLYLQPFQELKKFCESQTSKNFDFIIDIWGQEKPSEDILLSNVIEYKGAFTEDRKAEILLDYDYGIVTYSFNHEIVDLMQYSLPSKLIDYLSSNLKIICICPQALWLNEFLKKDKENLVFNSLDIQLILETIMKNSSNRTLKNQTIDQSLFKSESIQSFKQLLHN
ncbi:MAG: hypothetical protein U0T83_04250 [Bacteriovoracaceae bacterium]